MAIKSSSSLSVQASVLLSQRWYPLYLWDLYGKTHLLQLPILTMTVSDASTSETRQEL